MTDIQIAGGTLLANDADRTVSGLLVPFGEPCRSNLGRFTVTAGALQIPVDVPGTVGFNDGHVREQPIGRGVLLAERQDGIHATFAIAQGAEGDRALADIRSGARRHLSVEAADVAIVDGRAVSGRIFGAALVAQPAFPSATLLAAAADTTDPQVNTYETHEQLPDGSELDTQTTVEEESEEDPATHVQTLTRTTTEVTTITPGDPAGGGNPPMTDPTTATPAPLLAQVPQTLQRRAGRSHRPATRSADQTVNRRTLYAMLAQASRTRSPQLLEQLRGFQVMGTLLASDPTDPGTLADITMTEAGSPNDMIVPQWIGELWSGRAYKERYKPLFAHADLSSPSVKGWRWKTKPGVAKWEGNKQPVPTGGAETEPYDVDAQPFAGAHDVDRRFRDFSVPEFWDGYFTAMTESYSKQSDLYVVDTLLGDDLAANTTALTADTVPANVNPAMGRIIDGALAVLDEDLPSWAIVSKADYRSLLLTRSDDSLAYLNAALGLEEGTLESFRIVPSSHVAFAGNHTLVGCTSAATVHELSGSPIRIEGLDMVRGGIDPGLFGYEAVAIHNPAALAYVAPNAG